MNIICLLLIALVSLPSALSCADSTTFTFDTVKDGFTRQRKCTWLTYVPSKAPFRIDKFCKQESGGSYVDEECPASCGLCPTPAPTGKPTASASPTTEESACFDHPTYKFDAMNNGFAVKRSCQWLTANEFKVDSRTSQYCGQTSNGSVVKDKCKIACDNCSTEAPSSMPSAVQLPKPSSIPSSAPSMTPSVETCQDSSTFQFITVSAGFERARKCQWLTAKDSAFRIAKFCRYKGVDGVTLVSEGCPISCASCPSAVPTAMPSTRVPSAPSEFPSGAPTISDAPTVPFVCLDSATYVFTTYKNKLPIERKCAWIAQTPTATTTRRNKFCNQVHNGSRVGDECAASCTDCTP
jgi:hypothetical protein